MIGKILSNRYRILREIGSGGMAWVYLAEDLNEKTLVAVKVLYPQFSEDLSYVHRFNREARLAIALDNLHIVNVLDYGADRDVNYLVMEYIVGRDLRDIIDEHGSYRWPDALELLDQLAIAVEHAATHNIVHRDIKPHNLMIDENGILKVLDFGIARVDTLPSLTQSGFIGSPYYVSPEQAMSEPVDIRSDIYSSGIVFYELLTGNIPFNAKSPWTIINQHISSDLPPIEITLDDVSQHVHALLDKMVAKRPDERFQNPGELRQAIGELLARCYMTTQVMDDAGTMDIKQKLIIESRFQRGLKAFKAQSWARSAYLFNEVLAVDPNHARAVEKLASAQEQAKLIGLYHKAQRALQNGYWQDALDHCALVIGIQADYEDIQKIKVDAEAGLVNGGSSNDNRPVGLVQAEPVSVNPKSASQSTNWGMLGVGAIGVVIIIIMVITFLMPSVTNTGSDLRSLYQQAQEQLEGGNEAEALALLRQISDEDPDYADVADQIRYLSATPTPTATPLPEPTATLLPTQTPTPELAEQLAPLIDEAQGQINAGQWDEAIDELVEFQAEYPNFEKERIASMLCDAYVGRGLDTINAVEGERSAQVEAVTSSFADFEAGSQLCPRRIDLKDQANRATAYLEALEFPGDSFNAIIDTLNPVVSADDNYANGNAKQFLYNAYVGRGEEAIANDNIFEALRDFDAGVALHVPDPSLAQSRRAELVIQISQPPTLEPIPTVASESDSDIPAPTTQVEIDLDEVELETNESIFGRRNPPILVGPPDDTVFAGRLVELVLEWEIEGELAEDEYYDVTVMYIFADEPSYWGTATKENNVQLKPEIGMGVAGQDRFYWWVTIRQEGSTLTENSLDLAVSDRSDTRTFVWLPD